VIDVVVMIDAREALGRGRMFGLWTTIVRSFIRSVELGRCRSLIRRVVEFVLLLICSDLGTS
jgi:hypothetical protein